MNNTNLPPESTYNGSTEPINSTKKIEITNPEEAKTSFWKELLKFALIAVFIIIPFRLYVAQPFIVNGASMDFSFKNGEYLIVDEITNKFTPPVRGSVLIFKAPPATKDTGKDYIKRVIGLPGDTVSIEGQKVKIINKENPNGFYLTETYIDPTNVKTETTNPIQVGNDEYFVLGDNRIGSYDSRYWGLVPKANIIGRPFLRLFPLTRISVLPGQVNYSNDETKK